MSTLSAQWAVGAVTSVLRGIAQIFFIADWRTGAFITAGVALYDPMAAGFMILGAIAQILGSWAEQENPEDRREGIAGFNGALIGVVSWTLSPSIQVAFLLTMLGGFAVASIFRLFERIFSHPVLARVGFPVSTAPFCLLATGMFLLIPVHPPAADPTSTGDTFGGLGLGILNGFAEVVLADGPLTGLLILIGLVIGAPIGAATGLIGCVVATVAAEFLVGPNDASTGMLTYSAVLTAIALGSVFLSSRPIGERLAWALAGALLSVGVTMVMRDIHGPVFTWPFLVSMWVVMGFVTFVHSRRGRETAASVPTAVRVPQS